MLRSIISGNYASMGEMLVSVAVYVLSALFIIFCTQPVHEFAHAWAANKLGDPTAKYRGRLTLNPMRHINIIGAGMILLFGFGWADPVPVNQRNFKNPKRDMAIVALMGPLSNIVLSFICLLVGNLALTLSITFELSFLLYIYNFFIMAAWINITLAVFNLIPVPPLDGSRILYAILPDRIYYKVQMYEQYIFYAVLALCLFGAFNGFIYNVSNAIMNGLNRIAWLPFELALNVVL